MLSNDRVKLEKLTVEDADFFYEINTHPALTINFDKNSFLENETPKEFTERVIAASECIFTIRQASKPDLIIGDCALHHWDKQNNTMAIGGSLFPEYWGKGFMQAAFELLIEIAKKEFGVMTLLGQTKTRNIQAIRLVEKMGFEKYRIEGGETIMRKKFDEFRKKPDQYG